MKQVKKIPIKLGMSGKYKIMVGKKPGGVESEQRIVTDWFPNLITNGGLDYLGEHSFQNGSVYCQVGAGSTAPAFTDTTLISYLANTNSVSDVDSVNLITLYQQKIRTYSFGEGVAAGNLAEVGVGWATSGSLFSRALILDSEGDPTTITVLSDEYLTVIYSYRIYGILADTTGSVTFTGDLGGTYGYTIRHGKYRSGFYTFGLDRAMKWNALNFYCTVYDGTIGAINEEPSGNSSNPLTNTVAAYTPSSLLIATTVLLTPAQGNFDDSIKSLQVPLNCFWQVEFNPVIPKTDQDSLSLTFELTWGRK